MWILYCGKTDEELLGHPLSQLAVDTMLEQSGNIIDRAEELFVKIKVQYPNKKEVIDYLDFVDKPVENNQEDKGSSDSYSHRSQSVTVNLGRGVEYLKAKLPALKAEVDTRYKSLQEKFDSEENSERKLMQKISGFIFLPLVKKDLNCSWIARAECGHLGRDCHC